jgi:hypothetical protein
MPRFRNDSSRRRCESVSKLKVVVSKICGSGLKVTFVPRLSGLARDLQGDQLRRAGEADLVTFPSLRISAESVSESAFTTDTPTPCRPPDTL